LYERLERMKKLLAILVLGLLLGALASCDYLEKRKDCKEESERMETTYLEKMRYKDCMDE